MRRKVVLIVAVVVGVLLLCGLYTGLTVGRHLLAARSALSGSVADLDSDGIAAAGKDLRAAADGFDDIPVRLLRLVPVVRQNLDALHAAASASVDVVDQAAQLRGVLDRVEEEGLISSGQVRTDLLESMRDPLSFESENFHTLANSVRDHLSGWLLPNVWEELDALAERSEELNVSASEASNVIGQVGSLLGENGSRTYLVMILNNAELRGAGGIPSALGTLSIEDGRLHLGRFLYYRKLDDRPYKKVPAPADFKRRYARYKSDTTLWVNTTFDPDLPDTALVASRLFKRSTGIATDGVLVADPRGIASLLDPDVQVPISNTESLAADEIPDFSYSTSYEELGGASPSRRDATLRLGRSAFDILINEEGSAAGLDRVGDAVAGGHLRFVSLHDAEASALVAAGASGALDEPASDFVLSSVQNLGADKLDFHAARKIEHSCDLTDERGPLCATKVTISNEAPQGLPRYVAPNDPYGIMKSFAEIYIPGRAEVSGVFQGEKSVDYFEGTQDGLRAVGVKMQILPGEQEDLSVVYRMPPGEAYALVVVPQPLSHDADLSVTLDLGADQTVRGPGELKEGVLTYEGALTGTTNFVVEPDRRAGLSKAWQKVVRFWNEPIS